MKLLWAEAVEVGTGRIPYVDAVTGKGINIVTNCSTVIELLGRTR